MQDLELRKIHIAALQETHTPTATYGNDRGKLHCLGGKYGMAFYVNDTISNYLYGLEKISERISVIHFILSKNSRETKMSIINAYGPTAQLTQKNPVLLDSFYEDMRSTYTKCKQRSSIVVLCGDFNAKLGKKMENEYILGSYTYGNRNLNGNHLATFMTEENLLATNTCFQHKVQHVATRRGYINGRKNTSQIDYIIIPRQIKRLMTQSRVYRGHQFHSDHHPVVTTFNLCLYYKQVRKIKRSWRPDLSILASDPDMQNQFAHMIENALDETSRDEMSPSELYHTLCDSTIKSARAIIPEKLRTLSGTRSMRNDTYLQDLYKKCRKLTEKIRRNPRNKLILNRKRHAIRKKIKARIRKHWNAHYAAIATEVNSYPAANGQRAFEAARMLKSNTFTPFSLEDQTGVLCKHSSTLANMVTTYYQSFYNQLGKEAPAPWIGDARALNSPITTEQVLEAIKSLKNGRAAGPDEVYGEYLKYGGPRVATEFAKIFNKMFEHHSSLPELLDGILIPLNKPAKQRRVENTRPITLLNTIRKLLSNIVLQTARPALEGYISVNQSGFRRNRSTTDVIWTYRWMIAHTQKYQEAFYIMGIDLSKAFDCLDRDKLMSVISSIVSEDQRRIINYLLSETTLSARIQDQVGPKFRTTIGTPQGDGLSPILFVTYLEGAMRSFRGILPEGVNFSETSYADDQDLICRSIQEINVIQDMLPAHLTTWNLKMNAEKTEHICLTADNIPTLLTKKLGSKLQDVEDITLRVNMANIAMRSLHKIWKAKKYISLETKLAMYRAFITPVLTYNLAASGATGARLERLEVAQRRHLRRILGIYYPNRISNINLYDRCKCSLLKSIITMARWKLFGHLLRQPLDTPSNKAMVEYFTSSALKYRGRRPSSLISVLHRDAAEVHRELKTIRDLQDFRNIASNRRAWKRLTAIVTSKRTRKYMQELQGANMEASVGQRARNNLTITIPRRLWQQPQERLDDQDFSSRRRRLRLTLTTSADVGDTEPNVLSIESTENSDICYYFIITVILFVLSCFFLLICMEKAYQ